jgi:hypothetical protein
VILLLQTVAINVALGGGGLLMYSPVIALGSIGLSLFGALLSAGIGVFFSLRAATVRSVQQMLGGAAFLLLLVPLVGARLVPALGINMRQLNLTMSILSIMAGLAILDATLLLAAIRRFQRSRLVLD